MTIHLIRLDCRSCGSALTGRSHDILFLCPACGAGSTLEGEALEPVEASALLPAPGRRATAWRPGWRLEARVEVGQRVLADGRSTSGSTTERVFVVPAFPLRLTDLTQLSRAFTRVAPTLTEVPREPIPGGTLSRVDAETFVRHLVVGEEVAKPDLLASVSVTVEVTAARLTALPFDATDDRLTCAVTGLTVREQ